MGGISGEFPEPSHLKQSRLIDKRLCIAENRSRVSRIKTLVGGEIPGRLRYSCCAHSLALAIAPLWGVRDHPSSRKGHLFNVKTEQQSS